MAQDFAKAFYNSTAWLKCRAAYISSVFGLCERCRQPGDDVHHKIELSPANINDPNITLNWELLEYLCKSCHTQETKGSAVVRNGLMFDESGQLIRHTPLSSM